MNHPDKSKDAETIKRQALISDAFGAPATPGLILMAELVAES